MASLRAKKPTTVKKRMKALFYGPAGVGKTTAALQFPKCYYVDTERGAENDQYTKALEAGGGVYWFTTDPDELIEEVTNLLATKHDYQTLVIDPLTVIYNDLLDRGMETEGTDFGRYKIPADRKTKRLLSLLTRLDMNVIITSHAKAKWVRSHDHRGKETAVQEGFTFDAYPKLDYLFDLVFEIEKQGKDRIGIVRKSRVSGFPEDDRFLFNYDEIADRYGRGELERNAKAVELATPEQVARLNELLAERVNGDDLRAKWLKHANADDLREMEAKAIEKCIEHLTKGAA